MPPMIPVFQSSAIAVVGVLLTAAVAGCGSIERSFGGLAGVIVAREHVDVMSAADGTHMPADNPQKRLGSECREPRIASIKNSAPHDTSKVDLTPSIVSKEISPMTQSVTPAKTVQSAKQTKVESVDASDFRKKVLASDVPVLVDFYADWCGPCRMLTPILEQTARDTPDVKVVKVNIDHSPRLADAYGVTAVPTMIVFKHGVPVAHQSGLANKGALRKLLAL